MHLKHGAALQGGKYRIEKLLGQGGFGITYLAYQPGLDRYVAIKEFFMKEHCNRDADTSHVSVPSVGSRELVAQFKEKFIKESRMIAGYDHSHIVSIYDNFEENGTAYYVMKYYGSADGKSTCSLAGLPLPLSCEEAVGYVRQISSALSYLHSRSVMHLDVKPSNVLIDSDGNAVLIDFGVSKRYDQAGHQTSSTPVGVSKGYAPIEQYSQSTLEFNPATDIYSLGATLYKLLTGEVPHEASLLVSNPKLLTFPSSVSEPMAALIRRCLSPGLDARPQSIAEFLGQLDDALAAASVSDDDTVVEAEGDDDTVITAGDNHDKDKGGSGKKEQEPAPKKKSRRWLWWLLAALILVGVGVFAVMPSKSKGWSGVHNGYYWNSTPDSASTASKSGVHNGHQWVDLGLSVKWATCNVGASVPGDYGNYYAWGETWTKPEYLNCTSYGKSWGDIGGDSSRDAATANWGGSWRMPTEAEFQELINNCDWTWTTQNGKNGYKVTSKKNGQSIFLPAAGGRYGDRLYSDGEYGSYWSSTPTESISVGAFDLYFDEGSRLVDWYDRCGGRSIRPVLEE